MRLAPKNFSELLSRDEMKIFGGPPTRQGAKRSRGPAARQGAEKSPEAEPNTRVRKVSTHGKNILFLGLWKMVDDGCVAILENLAVTESIEVSKQIAWTMRHFPEFRPWAYTVGCGLG